ncbi:hypothetical protein C8R42DRAFT_721798 [Lentinula raphanica]|nr:hypothetical protein C8R42DRAFT_721798 [Lentinula raphanica]
MFQPTPQFALDRWRPFLVLAIDRRLEPAPFENLVPTQPILITVLHSPPDCTTMHYFSSLSTSIIANPCFLSMMGMILLTIANGTVVRAMNNCRTVPHGYCHDDAHRELDRKEQDMAPYGIQHDDAVCHDLGEENSKGIVLYGNRPVVAHMEGQPIRRPPVDQVDLERTINVWISDLDHDTNPTDASTIVFGHWDDPRCRMYRSRDGSQGPLRAIQFNRPDQTPPSPIPDPRPTNFVLVAVLRAPDGLDAHLGLLQANIRTLATLTPSNFDFIVASIRESWMAYGLTSSPILVHLLHHQEVVYMIEGRVLYILPSPYDGFCRVPVMIWGRQMGRPLSLPPQAPAHH